MFISTKKDILNRYENILHFKLISMIGPYIRFNIHLKNEY